MRKLARVSKSWGIFGEFWRVLEVYWRDLGVVLERRGGGQR